jgi:hypothetical protein
MTSIKEQMNEIKVDTYKDCVWYMDNVDKCKLTLKRKQYCDCMCKEEMHDMCIWLTKFLKSSSPDIKGRDIFDDGLLVEYGFLLGDYDPAKSQHIMANLLKKMNPEEEVNPFEE